MIGEIITHIYQKTLSPFRAAPTPHLSHHGLPHLPASEAAFNTYKFIWVTQSWPTLCDPVDCSMPGFPVRHQLLELGQTHVHRVSDAIQPSHPLSSPSPPAFNLSQHQGLFQQSFPYWLLPSPFHSEDKFRSFPWMIVENVNWIDSLTLGSVTFISGYQHSWRERYWLTVMEPVCLLFICLFAYNFCRPHQKLGGQESKEFRVQNVY